MMPSSEDQKDGYDGEITFHSHDIVIQSKDSIGTITADGLSADMEFFSGKNCSLLKGEPLTNYNSQSHPDGFNDLQQYWSNSGGYPYVGKSAVGRSLGKGEAGFCSPKSALDLQMHPPKDGCSMIGAFVVPAAGVYHLYHVGLRRVTQQGGSVTLKVIDQEGHVITSIQSNTSAWMLEQKVFDLGSLALGRKIFFSVESDDGFDYDAAEVSFSLTLNPSVERMSSHPCEVPSTQDTRETEKSHDSQPSSGGEARVESSKDGQDSDQKPLLPKIDSDLSTDGGSKNESDLDGGETKEKSEDEMTEVRDEESLISTILQWNVYYQNKDTAGIAKVIDQTNPDIVGLNEFTASMSDMAEDLSLATGREFRA